MNKIPSIVKTNAADLPNSGTWSVKDKKDVLCYRPGSKEWEVLNNGTAEKLEIPYDASLNDALKTGLRPEIIDGKDQYREVVDGRFIKQFKRNSFLRMVTTQKLAR